MNIVFGVGSGLNQSEIAHRCWSDWTFLGVLNPSPVYEGPLSSKSKRRTGVDGIAAMALLLEPPGTSTPVAGDSTATTPLAGTPGPDVPMSLLPGPPVGRASMAARSAMKPLPWPTGGGASMAP